VQAVQLFVVAIFVGIFVPCAHAPCAAPVLGHAVSAHERQRQGHFLVRQLIPIALDLALHADPLTLQIPPVLFHGVVRAADGGLLISHRVGHIYRISVAAGQGRCVYRGAAVVLRLPVGDELHLTGCQGQRQRQKQRQRIPPPFHGSRPGILRRRGADAAERAGILPQEPFAGGGLLPQLDGPGRIRAGCGDKYPQIARLNVLRTGIGQYV